MQSAAQALTLPLVVIPPAAPRCLGCCVNDNAARSRVEAALVRNRQLFDRISTAPVLLRRAVLRHNVASQGWATYLLAGVLAPLTLGLTLWIWWRWMYVACPFAGYLARERGEAGCLIHPRRRGPSQSGERSWAPWMLIPWMRCRPGFLCRNHDAVDRVQVDPRAAADWFHVTEVMTHSGAAATNGTLAGEES